jgi:NAD(P)H dehydrogenase (quinone)
MYILVLFDSKSGRTQELAYLIAKGIDSYTSCEINARLRCVPKVSTVCEAVEPDIRNSGTPYVDIDDLKNCYGLALGSPTYFGNMSSHMKYFLEQTVPLWLNGSLCNKPFCVFTSSNSMHGGQESTLLSMMLPLMHHGMIMVGLPYFETNLRKTQTGGTPYGVSHYAHQDSISEDEKQLAIFIGKRLAEIAVKLNLHK